MSTSTPSSPSGHDSDRELRSGGLTAYEEVQASPEFQDLRKRFRGFVFPATAFFLTWYFIYVLMAAFAPGFMSIKVFANVNIGLIFGLLQFVTTFGITIIYVRWANQKFDPSADAIRERMEEMGQLR